MKWGRAVWMSLLALVVMFFIPRIFNLVGLDTNSGAALYGSILVAGILIPILLTVIYFKTSSVTPSTKHGFYLGLIIFALPLLFVLLAMFLFPLVLGASPGIGVAFVIGLFSGKDISLLASLLSALIPYILALCTTTVTGAVSGSRY
ncbi:MAG: hypothetical protein V4474_01935 [Patescibacteria group bacterium]